MTDTSISNEVLPIQKLPNYLIELVFRQYLENILLSDEQNSSQTSFFEVENAKIESSEINLVESELPNLENSNPVFFCSSQKSKSRHSSEVLSVISSFWNRNNPVLMITLFNALVSLIREETLKILSDEDKTTLNFKRSYHLHKILKTLINFDNLQNQSFSFFNNPSVQQRLINLLEQQFELYYNLVAIDNEWYFKGRLFLLMDEMWFLMDMVESIACLIVRFRKMMEESGNSTKINSSKLEEMLRFVEYYNQCSCLQCYEML